MPGRRAGSSGSKYTKPRAQKRAAKDLTESKDDGLFPCSSYYAMMYTVCGIDNTAAGQIILDSCRVDVLPLQLDIGQPGPGVLQHVHQPHHPVGVLHLSRQLHLGQSSPEIIAQNVLNFYLLFSMANGTVKSYPCSLSR